MRKSYLLLCFIALSFQAICQQAPKGMKYQAVARDMRGAVLADQQINLKVTLAVNSGQNWNPYYIETHNVTTNKLGLFTLVMGEGMRLEGSFTEVPWSTEDIWMEVALNTNNGYATVSNSRLLAVPYAFHALTANELVGASNNAAGVSSSNWSYFGNSTVNDAVDVLGSTNNADLVVITSNVERMRVLKEGNVVINRSAAIGANLKVDSTVVLNDKSGSTTNKGPFTVSQNSPTLLSGTLRVDLETDLNAALNVDGPTDLNSTLNVNNESATKLTGSLQVNKVSTFMDSVVVANAKPAIFTGNIRVDSPALFKNYVRLDNAALQQDTSSLVPNGALQVEGGAGVKGNLVVGGSARIGGGLTLGTLKVTDTISSTSPSTGAMTVAGGAGIAKQLNVGGTTTIGGKTTINNDLEVNAGSGQVVISGGTNAGESTAAAYPLRVNGKTQGIEIKLSDVGPPTADNNYITFKDKDNIVRGRIEGLTVDELNSDPWYRWDIANYTLYVVGAGVDVGFAIAELVAASSDVRVCVGLGVCVASPSIGTIIVKALVLAWKIVVLAQQTTNLVEYITLTQNNVGVSYSSGAGDYAEWLLKENPSVKLSPGHIVGIHKGKISLNTEGAERVMAISTNPIVLGNAPEAGKESGYEKVAFLGQVPVRVSGVVNAGDYILASKKNDGTAIAKNPDDMNIEDLSDFVGIAWTSSDLQGEKAVKVAVGLSTADLKTMVKQINKKINAQSSDLNDLKIKLNENNELLSKLIKGYNADKLPVDNAEVKSEPATSTAIKNEVKNTKAQGSVLLNEKLRAEIIQFMGAKLGNPDGDRLPEMSDELITKMLEWGTTYAKSTVAKEGTVDHTDLLWKKLKSDPEFKASLYQRIKDSYKQKIEEHKMLGKN